MLPYWSIYHVISIYHLCKEIFDAMHYVPIKAVCGRAITLESPLISCKKIAVWVKGVYILIELIC
jgi:hypothetical protein